MKRLAAATVIAAIALAAAFLASAASGAAVCRTGHEGRCVSPGRSCHPPTGGACETILAPSPGGRRIHVCVCGPRPAPLAAAPSKGIDCAHGSRKVAGDPCHP